MMRTSHKGLRSTTVYDSMWSFAAERQAVFWSRESGKTPPWTTDEIISIHRFTNAYRATDRVSQYLIRNVIYRGDDAIDEVFFRLILFKLFNRIDTWELLERELGEITYREYSFHRLTKILSAAKDAGQRIYSAAYIMPSGSTSFGFREKHKNHLRLIEYMMAGDVPGRIAKARTMKEAYEILLACPTIGPFLAYQLVTDINYSEMCDFSEMEFVVSGPGAQSGIRKCFRNPKGMSDADIIRWVTDRQEAEFEKRELQFRNLWGRRLQLIDVQNLFCELDKYARVAHPEVEGIGKRTRIKRKFEPRQDPIEYWFPPKWGLNERIAGSTPAASSEDAQMEMCLR